jgi:hypothetical protein
MWVAFVEKCCIKRDQMMNFVTIALPNFHNLLQNCVEDINRKKMLVIRMLTELP